MAHVRPGASRRADVSFCVNRYLVFAFEKASREFPAVELFSAQEIRSNQSRMGEACTRSRALAL